MGAMPPWDPLTQPGLVWAKVKVLDCTPANPTWVTPAVVRLAIVEVRGGHTLPSELGVSFGQPREAGQAYFYEMRAQWQNPTPNPSPGPSLTPNPPPSPLDRTPVEVPALGAVIWVWLEPSADGSYTIPTSRVMGAYGPDEGLHSRWFEDTPAARAAIAKATGG